MPWLPTIELVREGFHGSCQNCEMGNKPYKVIQITEKHTWQQTVTCVKVQPQVMWGRHGQCAGPDVYSGGRRHSSTRGRTMAPEQALARRSGETRPAGVGERGMVGPKL